MLDPKHPLYILSNLINWSIFETTFAPLYSQKKGRPAKSIRLMVGLLILKHLRNISDEKVVAQFTENAYYQYFCGEESFTTSLPCVPTELVEFRHRIGESGVELILKESIRVNLELENKNKDNDPKDKQKDGRGRKSDKEQLLLIRPSRKRTSLSLPTQNFLTRL